MRIIYLVMIGLLSINSFGRDYVLKENEQFVYERANKYYLQFSEEIYSGIGIIKKGNQLVKSSIKNGLLNGKTTVYTLDGQLKAKITFKNNIKHGKAEWWNKYGELKASVTYRDGKIFSGWERSFDCNITFNNYKKSGIERVSYHPVSDKRAPKSFLYKVEYKDDKVIKVSEPNLYSNPA